MDSNDPPAPNESNGNGPAAKKKRHYGHWSRRHQSMEPRERPISIEIHAPATSSNASNVDSGIGSSSERAFSVPTTAPNTIEIGGDSGPYVGWKIYFPTEGEAN